MEEPEEVLSFEIVEKWLVNFTQRLNRTTSRGDLDRLILSVERTDFQSDFNGTWKSFICQNGEGKVASVHKLVDGNKWNLTNFQKIILEKNPEFEGMNISRSQLREETGEGILFDTTKNMQKKIQHPGNNPDDRKLSEIEYRKRTERNIWLTMPTNEMYIRNPDS